MVNKMKKYTAKEISRIVIGIAGFAGLSLMWDTVGIMVGGIFMLMTAPRGFYE